MIPGENGVTPLRSATLQQVLSPTVTRTGVTKISTLTITRTPIPTLTRTVSTRLTATRTTTFTSTRTSTPVPTRTPSPSMSTTPIKTATKKSIQTSSCPGAVRQRVQVGQRAEVCTKRDRLILRESPGGAELDRLVPGTVLKIINGPECFDSSSWWKVEPDFGWTAGWVREGSDQTDPYYICPQ